VKRGFDAPTKRTIFLIKTMKGERQRLSFPRLKRLLKKDDPLLKDDYLRTNIAVLSGEELIIAIEKDHKADLAQDMSRLHLAEIRSPGTASRTAFIVGTTMPEAGGRQAILPKNDISDPRPSAISESVFMVECRRIITC
jgi:hypothetical protein